VIDGVSPNLPPEGLTQWTSPGGILNKDDFLQLLVTQMRHQDPMNPMDSDEFAAQLAQFSSLEQLINVNERLEGQEASSEAMAAALNQVAALNVIGREALTVGNGLSITGDPAQAVTVGVSGSGGTATLKIYDLNGNEVGSGPVGPVNGGRQEIPLDKLGSMLPAGDYRYAVEVEDTAGNPVEVQNFQRVRIDGVRYGPGGTVLVSGDLEIPLGDIVEVLAQDK
jgi:flagellar basal-body rod modification protein FlgD